MHDLIVHMKLRRAIFLMILFGLLPASCLQRSSAEPEQPPSIVLISIDGLRADYFTPERMPLLYDFARDNCRIYTNAHSNSTWSGPSHVTMLSGLLQSQHGVEYESSAIPAELTMIQQKLKKAGYTTAAFVDGGDMDRDRGFDRGFDTFRHLSEATENSELQNETFKERFGEWTTSFDEAEHFLLSHPDRPVFLFVRTSAVGNYRQKSSFANPEAPGDDETLQPDERRRLYAAAVLDCDKRLDRFLTLLRYSSIFPNSKVIITSAHGEGLGDVHEGFVSYGHANPPYSDQVDVPLIIYGLGRGKTNQLVGLDDIAGTILKLARIEPNPLKSLSRKRTNLVSEYVPRDGEETGRAVAIISEQRKFLVSFDGDLRLFRDPKDSIDLIRLQHTELTKEDISEGLKQQLNALGYLQ